LIFATVRALMHKLQTDDRAAEVERLEYPINNWLAVLDYVTPCERGAAEEVVQSIRSHGKVSAIAVCADTPTLEGGEHLFDEAVNTLRKIDILIVFNAGIGGGGIR
jgi:NAD(P)-dependent dehydrogenase (short-subunit alcohol dehydrogenase family)